jgi:DNA-binding NarL/FixJ family response regulator
MSTTIDNLPKPTRRSALTPEDDNADPRSRTVEVVLVDDDRTASYSLWALLSWRPGIRISAIVQSPTEAITAIRRLRPDVCMVAAAVGEGEGLNICHAIKQLPEPPRVLVYDERASAELEGAGMIAGVDGTVSRYGDADRLERTIKRLAGGELGEQPTVGADCVGDLIDRVPDRDRPIAAMLLERVWPDDIAEVLGISASSFRARRREIVKRIGRSVGGRSVQGVTRLPLSDLRHRDSPAVNGGRELPARRRVVPLVSPEPRPAARAHAPCCDRRGVDDCLHTHVVAVA